jgi:hypothetical protein
MTTEILAQSPKFFFDFDYMGPVLESPADFDGKKCSEVVFSVFDVFSVNTRAQRNLEEPDVRTKGIFLRFKLDFKMCKFNLYQDR